MKLIIIALFAVIAVTAAQIPFLNPLFGGFQSQTGQSGGFGQGGGYGQTGGSGQTDDTGSGAGYGSGSSTPFGRMLQQAQKMATLPLELTDAGLQGALDFFRSARSAIGNVAPQTLPQTLNNMYNRATNSAGQLANGAGQLANGATKTANDALNRATRYATGVGAQLGANTDHLGNSLTTGSMSDNSV